MTNNLYLLCSTFLYSKSMNSLLPKTLESLPFNHPDLVGELKSLKTLEQAGLVIAPLLVIPAALEEHFYHLNNLPAQLSKLFANINLKRPDEDDLEDLAPQAQSLIKKHFFLDEIIDMIYSMLQPMPERVVLRRPDENGLEVLNGRPALMAIKDLWAEDWTFEVLLERLEKSSSIAITERPIIIQNVGGTSSEALSKQASQLLGNTIQVEANQQGVTRVLLPSS
jgi:hypothetical protein